MGFTNKTPIGRWIWGTLDYVDTNEINKDHDAPWDTIGKDVE